MNFASFFFILKSSNWWVQHFLVPAHITGSLGFLNVENRDKQFRLHHAFKIFNGTCPSYLSEHFRKVSDFHMYSTRKSLRILLFHTCLLDMLPRLSSSMALKTEIHYLQKLRGKKISADLKLK